MGVNAKTPHWKVAVYWGAQLGRWVILRKRTFHRTTLLLTYVQWTLASVFDLKGWFFSKVDLAVVFMYWTIFFLFDKNIDSLASRKRGFDVYRRLAKCLDSCKEVCGILR